MLEQLEGVLTGPPRGGSALWDPVKDPREAEGTKRNGVSPPGSLANTAPSAMIGRSVYIGQTTLCLFTVTKTWLLMDGNVAHLWFIIVDHPLSPLAPNEWMIVPFMVHGCGQPWNRSRKCVHLSHLRFSVFKGTGAWLTQHSQ